MTAVHSDFLNLVRLGIGHRAEVLSANPDWDAIYDHAVRHGLPAVLVDKVPIDGLCGKTDEENLGFTYAELDRYIREGIIEDEEKKAKIDRLHKANLFKLQLMPSFKPEF